ncbi:unnamed protein product [Schistosoma intercalatum]|nr:unnamed protein product [Schistosoma intercalatum]
MLVIGIPSSSQIVSHTPDFLLPVARMSWKSFRWLPDAAAASNSLARSDHQASRSLHKLCLISVLSILRLWSNSRSPGVDRRASMSCKEPEETQCL